ncbi:MAG: type II secretion system F family protein [Actinomycetota bacterium]
MSSLYLPLALVATFSTVVIAGLVIDLVLARRRRVVDLLESQIEHMTSSVREQVLSRSFVERVISPVVAGLGSVVRRITPYGMNDRIEHKLALAGSPARWDVERIGATKVLGGLAGGGLAALLGLTSGASPLRIAVMTVGLAGLAFVTPDVLLSGMATRRQEQIRKALPDTMDLLTISVEAGIGFDGALAQVVHKVPGELSDEIARMLQEVQLGESRVDAFKNLAQRTKVEELDSFVLAMIQADVFGVSVSKVLRAQAAELRTRRRQRAERKAMQVPVKILFPTIFCVLPSLLVVILGPAVIRIANDLFGSL